MHFDALAERRFPAPGGFAALAALIGVPAALGALGVPLAGWLRYDRGALAAGEWWRLASAHLVHHDLRHFALNLTGLAFLWALYRPTASAREWWLVLAAAMLVVDAGLYWLEPAVHWYLGASGILHGCWAAGAVFIARRSRAEALVTLALLAAKLALESRYGALTAGAGLLPVVTAAHRYGALGGLAAALALRARAAPL